MTDTERGFMAAKVEQLASELAAEKEKSRSVSNRLTEAETALRFYADPRSYKAVRSLLDSKLVLQNELQGDFSNADNDPNTKLAGFRAREYFKRYED